MKILLGLAALASVAFADITYSVVGYRSNEANIFGVEIGGIMHKLATNENILPVFTGVVPGATSAQEYSYHEITPAGAKVRSETFVRKFTNTSEIATVNEFFERPTTIWDLPHIPYTYMATFPSKTKAFKQKQIATIHVTAPVAAMNEMNLNPTNDKDYQVDFRFISSKTIHSVKNVTFSTSGKSSKDHSKQAFAFEFEGTLGQTFFSRPNIKLRSMVQDPTMMREKVYIDMLNSVGVPTQQGAWVRLFVNNEPYGLYLMVDDIKKSFLKQTIHGGQEVLNRGSLIQMNAWKNKASLEYLGPTTASYDPSTYTSQNLGLSPVNDPLKELITFMSDLKDFNPTTTPDPIGYFNGTRLELDGFLRCMALEYLMGAFDMYWYSGSNYFMYHNPLIVPAPGHWQWIPTDMDGTFGSGYPTATIPSYTTWTNFATQGPRPLVQKLILENAEIGALFKKIMQEIVTTAFKPEALMPRIQAYNKMLQLDAAWDLSIKRRSPGKNNNFTMVDFNNNVYNRTTGMQFGLESWIKSMTTLVSTELGFTIPAGLADRVAPPPKKSFDNDDGDDGDAAPGGRPGSGNGSGNGSGSGGKNAGSRLSMMPTTGLLVVVALFSALML
ncbi:hypothetical protein BG006_010229 [Podila minutissima]|uniref:Coth-domain-containing protein n=1 Tax=Podila minutissima TaxID=64525 RepID=A0A9P5VRD4_9FUNG|nr:hypothetical protein BG006_010229 [Podila minutissima]